MDAAREEHELAAGGLGRGEDPADPGRGTGAEQHLHVQGLPHVGGQVGDVLLGVDVGRPHHRERDGVADESQVVDVSVALQGPGVLELEAGDDEVLLVGDDEALPRAELQDPVEGHLEELLTVRVTGEVQQAPRSQCEPLLTPRNYPWSATS